MTHRMLKWIHMKGEEEIQRATINTFLKKQIYSQYHVMFEKEEETFYIHTLVICFI